MANNVSDIYRVSTVDYVSLVKLSYESVLKYYEHYWTYSKDYSFPSGFVSDLRTHCKVSLFDLFLCVTLAVLWTALRFWLTNVLFTPWIKGLHLKASIAAKMPESLWKLGFYTCTWSWSLYVVILSGRYKCFQDPLSIWDDWSPDLQIPWDIFVAYMWQASFYVHSLYAIVYMDVWRKDSSVMIVHHFLTLALIIFSYGMRHHMIGALVLLLHDINDIELEFTKLNTYLKHRGGQYYHCHNVLASIAFAAFALSWFLFRLYWFPLKVLYMGLYGSVHLAPPNIPFIPFFNGMLTVLLAMNLWWFHFILLLLWRLATGRGSEVDDTRELDSEHTAEQLQANGDLSHTARTLKNGDLPSKKSD